MTSHTGRGHNLAAGQGVGAAAETAAKLSGVAKVRAAVGETSSQLHKSIYSSGCRDWAHVVLTSVSRLT